MTPFHLNEALAMLWSYCKEVSSPDTLHHLELLINWYTIIYSTGFTIICLKWEEYHYVIKLIGLLINSWWSNSSSIIGAYWLDTITALKSSHYNITMRIRQVQYFCKYCFVARMPEKVPAREWTHTCTCKMAPEPSKQRIAWFICYCTNEEDLPCTLIAVKRIHTVCLYRELNVAVASVPVDVLITTLLPTLAITNIIT